MTKEELDQRLRNFEKACLELFRDTAILDREALPFTIEVQDARGDSLLSAQLRVSSSDLSQALIYLSEDHLQRLMN